LVENNRTENLHNRLLAAEKEKCDAEKKLLQSNIDILYNHHNIKPSTEYPFARAPSPAPMFHNNNDDDDADMDSYLESINNESIINNSNNDFKTDNNLEYDSIMNNNNNNNNRLTNHTPEKDSIKDYLETVKNQKKELERTILYLNSEKDELKKKITESNKNSILANENTELTKNNKSLSNEINELDKKNTSLENEIYDLKKKNNELDDTNTSLTNEIYDLKKKNTELDNKNTILENQDSSISRYINTIYSNIPSIYKKKLKNLSTTDQLEILDKFIIKEKNYLETVEKKDLEIDDLKKKNTELYNINTSLENGKKMLDQEESSIIRYINSLYSKIPSNLKKNSGNISTDEKMEFFENLVNDSTIKVNLSLNREKMLEKEIKELNNELNDSKRRVTMQNSKIHKIQQELKSSNEQISTLRNLLKNKSTKKVTRKPNNTSDDDTNEEKSVKKSTKKVTRKPNNTSDDDTNEEKSVKKSTKKVTRKRYS